MENEIVVIAIGSGVTDSKTSDCRTWKAEKTYYLPVPFECRFSFSNEHNLSHKLAKVLWKNVATECCVAAVPVASYVKLNLYQVRGNKY